MKSINPIDAPMFALMGCVWAVSLLGSAAEAAEKDRIAGPIDGRRVVILEGNLSSKVAEADDRGALDPLTPIGYIRMALKQTAAQSSDLEQLLESQRNPTSPDYHRWLTPEEYGERFGVSRNDLDHLTMWLRSEGFVVQQVARAGNWIAFSGNAGQIARTFHTELHRYQANGESHFANATAPWIPEALDGLVGELHGLNDYHPKPPRIKRINPDLTTSAGAHYLAPDDLAEIYNITALYKAGFDGTGQKLAIAGQTDINLADIRGFRAQFGLVAKDPQLVLYGTDPGVSSGDQIEADLDLEWSGAVARNATIVYVYSQDVFESVQYAIDQNLAPVISMSYGECEIGAPVSYRSLAQQANAEGMTWMNSSGDGGAAGCDYDATIAKQGPAVTFPADIPEITAVGGTEFNESGSAGWSSQNSLTWQSVTGYLPEIGWNDTALGGGIWASGGGSSVLFTKPWWQAGPGVPSDNARDVPDISLSASGDHDGYVIYASGALMPVGGTSASSPSFAGIVTLINQYVVTKGTQSKPGLGNINPNLYALAQNTTGVIHDVTSGDNIVPCKSGTTDCETGSYGYSAGVGYDRVTGLGSVDAYNLAVNWASPPTPIGTTTALTASPATIAQSASTQLTAKVTTVTGSAGPAGSVTFTAGGVALGSAAAIVSGATASAVLSVNGTSLAVGADSITATYTPTGSFSSSTASTTVTVTGAVAATTTTVAANPVSIATAGTTQLTATVTPASGSAAPSGTVTFSAGNIALGTATLATSGTSSARAATATLSVAGSKLAAGANSIVASYAGGEGFAASASSPLTVTLTGSLTATTVTITASAATIAPSASTLLTVSVKPASGTAGPTGSVTFADGNTSLGTATLVVSGATASASLTVKGASLAPGSNSITASYMPTGNFGASIGSTSVTVTGAPVATTTTITATPASIAATGSTQLTATVTPASGSAAPSGSVTFSVGNTVVGSETLSPSGTASTATLNLSGAKLAAGGNNIVASYTGVGTFTGSASISITVTVGAPLIATTVSIAASPASISQSASTVLAVTVTPVSGTAPPTGTMTFTAGNVSLGWVTLTPSGANAKATMTVKGSTLVAGSNAISASYSGDSKFAVSTGQVTVTVTAASTATTTVAAASPPTFAQNLTTQVTAMVKLVSGSALPTGTVSFAIGNTSLGSATLTVAAGMASAVVSVPGNKLALGSNTIVASYGGSSGFTPSTASVLVVVSAPTVATTTAITANQVSFAQSASTQLSVTVKAASGTVAPAGSITFSLGTPTAAGPVSLGTATLTGSGGAATATLTVKGSSLPVGKETIVATYAGAGTFSGSVGSVAVTVAAARASSVSGSAARTVSGQTGFPVKLQLQEQAGVATTITGFTINGTNFTPSIAAFFGTTQMAADATLTGTMVIQWNPLPATLVFVFTGVDASGAQWSQTISLATK